ncbi:MAG: hypothetical protein AAGH15_07060 [Myxococcota bacterium]
MATHALRSSGRLALALLLGGCSTTVIVGSIDGGAPDGGSLDGGLDFGAPDGGLDLGMPLCDDGNPCTRDRLVAGACEHTPLADGTACDDGDRCTHADVCGAGVCVGQAGAEGPAEVLASVEPRFRGQGTAVGGGRFLFIDRAASPVTLVLARAETSGFTSLDEAPAPMGARLVESLGPDLAVVQTQAGGQIVELRGDRLRLRGTFAANGAPIEVAYDGDRLWVCSAVDWLTTELREFDARDLGDLVDAGVVPESCQSLTVATTGAGAYFTTSFDEVFRLVPRAGLPARAESIGESAQAVHAFRGALTLTTSRGVRVLHEVGFVPFAHFEADPSEWVRSARVTPRGLDVLVSGASGLRLEVYAIDEGATPVLSLRGSEVIERRTLLNGRASGWASHEEGLRIVETGRAFLLGDDPPFLREVQDPDVSWPSGLRVVGAEARLRNAQRAVRIDLSDPANPVSLAGGAHGGDPEVVALEIDGAGRAALHADERRASYLRSIDALNFASSAFLPPADVVIRRFGADGRAIDRGRFDVGFHADPTRWDRLSVTDAFLYLTQRSREDDARHVDLERWSFAALEGAGTTPPPELGLRLEAPDGGSLRQHARLHGDDATAFVTVAPDGNMAIWWQPLSAGAAPIGPFLLGEGWVPADVAVAGDRVLVVAGRSEAGAGVRETLVLALERDAAALREVGRRDFPSHRESWLGGRQIVAMDGAFPYVYVAEGVVGAPEGALLGLRWDDLAGPVATYEVGVAAIPAAFERSADAWVMTWADRLVVGGVWCE